MNKYFGDCTNMEELKKAYRELAFKLHPDKGGNAEEFAIMKNAYDIAVKLLSKTEKNSKTSEDLAEQYKNIIDRLIHLDLEIELVGTWIWVTGSAEVTKANKELLKELKFFWNKKRSVNGLGVWNWKSPDEGKASYSNKSTEEVKASHGCTKIKGSSKSKSHKLI